MSEKRITETALYLTFKLDEEMFSIDVSQVREILDMITITKVPKSPDFMRGVINVRGAVVPVVDLRLKFGMPEIESTVDTRIIVMELMLEGENTVLGAIADAVQDVIELEPGQIEDPPRIGARWKTEFIRGMGKKDGDFIIILDIDRIFSTEELAILEASSDTAVTEAA